MDILVLNYEFPPIGGGGGIVSYDMARAYAEMGHGVTVVTMQYKGLPNHEVRDGFDIYRVKCMRKKEGVCYPWEQLSYIMAAKKFLKKHLEGRSYDVCHTHFIIPTGAVALWLKQKYGLGYIVTAHGSDVEGHNIKKDKMHSLLRGASGRIIDNAFVVTAPSEYLKTLLERNHPQGSYTVVPNGIFVDDYKPLEKKKRIITLSRLQPSKGVQDVIEAFARAGLEGWTLDIVGDGPYMAELRGLAENLGVQGSVVFHGWLRSKSAKLLGLLGEADIFVSASRFESFGLSVAEALASGARPLLSDIPAHRIFTSDDGCLFAVGDIGDMAEKLNNAAKCAQAFDIVDIGKFDWKNIAGEYMSLLESACKRN